MNSPISLDQHFMTTLQRLKSGFLKPRSKEFLSEKNGSFIIKYYISQNSTISLQK